MIFNIFCIMIFIASIFAQNMINVDPVDHIFHITSHAVEEATIKLLKTLKLQPNFVDSVVIQKDLDMYTYLKTTSNINYKMFRNIVDISSISSDKNNSQIDDVIDEMVNGTFNLANSEETINEVFRYFIPLITRESENPDDLSLEFIKVFIDKLNKMELSPKEEINLDNDTDIICQTSEEFSNKTSPCENKINNESAVDKPKTNHELIADNETFERDDLLEESIDQNDLAMTSMNSTIQFRNRRMQAWDPRVDCADQPTRRIYNGRKTSIKNYSFIVSVHDNGKFICVGSIIRKNLVLSAASCLQRVYLDHRNRNSPTSIYLRIGSDFVYTGGLVVHATHIIFHPEFDPISLQNNLVLLHVLKGEFSKLKWLKRLKYKRQESLFGDVRAGKDHVKILGWGEQSNELNQLAQTFTNKMPLSYEHLDVFSLEQCQDIYANMYVSENHFCAGFLLKGGACKNDIGGPGIRHGMLVGIVSFGPTHCGAKDHPTVFTRVTPYVDWIRGVIEDVLPKIKRKIEPEFIYNETWESRRLASYVYKMPRFDTFRKSRTIIKLEDNKQDAALKTNYVSDLEAKVDKSNVSKRALSSNYTTSMSSSANQTKGNQETDIIYEVDQIGAKRKAENEANVTTSKDSFLDFRPDISISREELNNEPIEDTTKNPIDNIITVQKNIPKESKPNKNKSDLNETIKTMKNLDQKFMFYQQFSSEEWKSNNDDALKSNTLFIAPEKNVTNSYLSTQTTITQQVTTPISADANKQRPNSDLRFVVIPNLDTGGYSSYENNETLYEEDYVNDPLIHDNNTIDYNGMESNTSQLIEPFDSDDSSLDNDDSDITDLDEQSDELEDNTDSEEEGLSIETSKSSFSQDPTVSTKKVDISKYVTAFNTNTPKRNRFDSVKERHLRNERAKHYDLHNV